MLAVENARLLWTGRREVAGATLVCEDGRVSRIAADRQTDEMEAASAAAVAATRLDATDCLVIPGLVNAHHHLLQSAFRTHPATRNLPMRDWLAEMVKLYQQAQVDPPLVATAAAVGIAESLLAGVTTIADHHLTWPTGIRPSEIAAAAIETAGDLGARFVFVHGTACGGTDELAASLHDLAARYPTDQTNSAAAGMFQLAVGPAGVHSDDQASFAAADELARELGLRRRTQANEQVDVEIAQQQFGRRPLELLQNWGWLEPDVTLAHLCEITPEELELVAVSGVSVTHAPGCDVPMGWGVAEVGTMLDAGVSVGLGTSGGGSNDAGHLLADARLAMQVSGLTNRPITAREALTMATFGSAAGLGRADTLGHLEPGAAADLCCYDLSGPDDAGVADPLAGLLWASPGRKPRHVVVAGEVVVEDWQLVSADAARLAESLRQEIDNRATA